MVDYLTENLWLLWTFVCVIALVLEISSGTFYLICFAIGAVGAVLVSLINTPFWFQILVFAAISTFSVYGIRPFLWKY